MESIIILLWIAIFIGLLVWTGKLASNKGRSVPLWVILGFLLNPIPLIVLACLGPAKR
jgi:hypothetical protein